MNKSIENLVRAACRALLAAPDLEPKIVIESRPGRSIEIEIDVFPFDFGPLCGEAGTMKLALQTVIAAAGNNEAMRITFAKSGSLKPTPVRSGPNAEAMGAFVTAAINHWRKLGFDAEGRVETSASAAIAILNLDNRLVNIQRGAFLRICRGIGKAQGFIGMAYVDRKAVAA